MPAQATGRRGFGRWALGAGMACCLGRARAEHGQLHEQRPLMGTLVDITLESPDTARLKPALELAYQEMTRLSDMMNHYNARSVVSAINMAAGIAPVPVPPELMQVLKMARQVSERSSGAFDITVASITGWKFNPNTPAIPSAENITKQLKNINYQNLLLNEHAGTAKLKNQGMRMDLGGIAKLTILDAGMKVLKRHGVGNAMINGGGDVLVMGANHGRPWRIGVRDPLAPERILGIIEMNDGVVASSGDYERFFMLDGHRYHHILDPKTGYPTVGPHGVTLVAANVDQVNGLGAAIMVMGAKAGRDLVMHAQGVDALIADQDESLWMSTGMSARLTLLAH